MVTLNDENEVLMVTWHKYPDSYVPGQQVDLKYGAVWTFTDKEIAQWYEENKNGVADWELRFEQLIGLPHDTEYTHFTAMWVRGKYYGYQKKLKWKYDNISVNRTLGHSDQRSAFQ